MSVAGSAKITYKNGDTTEVTGNPFGMNTSLAFSGSGDVNPSVSFNVTGDDAVSMIVAKSVGKLKLSLIHI